MKNWGASLQVTDVPVAFRATNEFAASFEEIGWAAIHLRLRLRVKRDFPIAASFYCAVGASG